MIMDSAVTLHTTSSLFVLAQYIHGCLNQCVHMHRLMFTEHVWFITLKEVLQVKHDQMKLERTYAKCLLLMSLSV